MELEADEQQWDHGTIKGLGWSEDEKLIVVTEDGTVRVYEGLQSDFVPFSLGHVWDSADSYILQLLTIAHREQKNMACSRASFMPMD